MIAAARTEEKEFRSIYGLEVVPVPTNKPVQRNDLPDLIYLNQYAKWKAVIAQSLTLEQRQIERQSTWQDWPLCTHNCFWGKRLKRK